MTAVFTCYNSGLKDRRLKNSETEALILYFFIETYGCQMNANESEKMAGLLSEAGHLYTDRMEEADLILVNTCTVRQKSADKVYGFIGRTLALRKTKPSLRLGVCGCLAEAENRALLRRKGVDFVFGTRAYPAVVEIVERAHRSERFAELGDFLARENAFSPIRRYSSHHAWVTIIYGCDKFCSYCIVPYTRGREKSRDFSDICAEVSMLAERGYREITFLGQNVDSYGKDLKEASVSFADILSFAAGVEGVERIWFLTSYPSDFTQTAIDTIANHSNIARAIHLPLQSGSDAVLKKMNRRYSREEFIDLTSRVRKAIPDAALSTDLIVGLPGETEEDFEQSVDLAQTVMFERLNLAMYSPREGTLAQQTLPDDIPYSVKNKRLQILLDLQKRINKHLNQENLGKKLWVIAEKQTKIGSTQLYGRTDRNRIVIFEGSADLIGKWVEVSIAKVTAGPLYGDISQIRD